MTNDWTIPAERRNIGTYIAGESGQGKSSLIFSMALHDIRQGHGVCVIDPTYDLVKKLAHWIPKSRVKDTIWFDTEQPFPINFFSYNKNYPAERKVLTDQLVAIFKLENAPIARPRVRRIIGTLFDANNNGGTFNFLDIQKFIESFTFRKQVFKFCPEREPQWEDMPPVKEFVSVTERLTPFFEDSTLAVMFGSNKGLSISNIMLQNKIFLVNVLDTETDHFIASLLTAKFQQATFRRRYLHPSLRTPYYLYIDECHTIVGYAVKEFEQMFTRARKYNLCLILANQAPSDLKEIRTKLKMLGNYIFFKLDPDEAREFRSKLRPYEFAQLDDLQQFSAIFKSSGPAHLIPTPHPYGKSPESYASIIMNTPKPQPPCNLAQDRSNQNSVDTRNTGKPDPAPGPSPSVPLHRREKKDARRSG